MKAYIGDRLVIKIMLGDKLIWQKPLVEVITPIVREGVYIATGSTNSTITNANGVYTTEWANVKPNTTYKIESNLFNRSRIQFRNPDGVIRYLDGSVGGATLTTYADTNEVRIYFYAGSAGANPQITFKRLS